MQSSNSHVFSRRAALLNLGGLGIAAALPTQEAQAQVASDLSKLSEKKIRDLQEALLVTESYLKEKWVRPTTVQGRENFRFSLIQPLLNQTADLIERCLKERKELEEFAMRDAQQIMDVFLQDVENSARRMFHEAAAPYAPDKCSDARIHSERHLGTEKMAAARKKLQAARESPGQPDHLLHNQDAHILAFDQTALSHDLLESAHNLEKLRSQFQDRLELILLTARESVANEMHLAMKSRNRSDFRRQMSALRERIDQDAADARARLIVAMIGMKELLGYTGATLPEDSDLDGILKCFRSCTSWLSCFGQFDQAFTKVLSLRTILKSNQFEEQLELASKNSRQLFEVSFSLKENEFAGFNYVRLQGVCAELVVREPAKTSGLWSIRLKPPRRALVLHKGAPKPNVIEQGGAFCTLGRVTSRDTNRPPEICGMIALMNLSPISANDEGGEWTLQMTPQSTDAVPIKNIYDLELELHLVSQS